MSNDPYKWDGSLLGTIKPDQIVSKTRLNGLLYWTIKINDCQEQGIIRRIISPMSSLIDEIKCIFNIEKLGTHRLLADDPSGKKASYLMIKADLQDNYKLCTLLLDKLSKEKYQIFVDQIRNYYAFNGWMVG